MIKYWSNLSLSNKVAVIVLLTILSCFLATTYWLLSVYLPRQQELRQAEVHRCQTEGGSWQHNSQSSNTCWINGRIAWFSKY